MMERVPDWLRRIGKDWRSGIKGAAEAALALRLRVVVGDIVQAHRLAQEQAAASEPLAEARVRDALFARLPALEPLVATVVSQEIAACDAMLDHYAAAQNAIAAAFGRDCPLGTPTAFDLGLSDPHNRRKSVSRLEFADGTRLIYKPRPVAMEARLAGISEWLTRSGAPYAPRLPRVVDGDGHGWLTFVDRRPCRSVAEVDEFYRHLGMLACLFAVLGATDCRCENLVASGVHPVLVDAETLVHPRIMASPRHDLMATELFPRQVVGPNGQTITNAGFDGARDDIHARHWPRLHRQTRYMSAHGEAVRRGVAAMALFLRERRAAFLAPDGPLDLLASLRSRVVLRPTSMYEAVVRAMLSAGPLARAWPPGDLIARLARYNDPCLAGHVWRRVEEAEQAALARLDIPYFLVDSGTGDLFDGEGECLSRGAFAPPIQGLRRDFDECLASAETFAARQM